MMAQMYILLRFSKIGFLEEKLAKMLFFEDIVCLVPLYFGKAHSRVWKVIKDVLRTFKCSRKLKFKNYGFKH